MEHEEEQIEHKQKKEEFVGRDLKQSYIYYRNRNPASAKESYFYLIKCVEFGKELLPSVDDKQKQQDIDTIYEEACRVLEEERLDEVKQSFSYADFGDDRVPLYRIKATDGGTFEVLEKDYSRAIEKFKENQYEAHLKNLKKADNKIFNKLTQYSIIEKNNPDLEETKNRFLKQEFEDMLSDLDAESA